MAISTPPTGKAPAFLSSKRRSLGATLMLLFTTSRVLISGVHSSLSLEAPHSILAFAHTETCAFCLKLQKNDFAVLLYS